MELLEAVGLRLRKARKRAHLSQVQAAAALGCSQSYVSKAETGQKRINEHDFMNFAQLYGVSVIELAGPLSPGERQWADARKAERDLKASEYSTPTGTQ